MILQPTVGAAPRVCPNKKRRVMHLSGRPFCYPPSEATGVFRAAIDMAAAPQRGANPSFATEELGEVVCPYRWLGTTLGANLLNRRSSTEAVLSRKRGARISEGDNRWAAGIPTSFVSLKNLSNSFQCFKDWKEFNVIYS